MVLLSTVVNATLLLAFGFNGNQGECDVTARGAVVWSQSDRMGVVDPGRWVTVEAPPAGADLPPCRTGSKKKSYEGEFRPV